nr:hypothetical protein [Rhodovibrio sodomensis]
MDALLRAQGDRQVTVEIWIVWIQRTSLAEQPLRLLVLAGAMSQDP